MNNYKMILSETRNSWIGGKNLPEIYYREILIYKNQWDAHQWAG